MSSNALHELSCYTGHKDTAWNSLAHKKDKLK